MSRLKPGPKVAIAVGGVLLFSTTILATVSGVATLSSYLESTTVLTVLGTLVLAVVTGFWLTHSIPSPVQAPGQGTQAVRPGDLSQSVAVATEDEIGILATDSIHLTAAIRAERDRAQRYLDTAGVFLIALDEKGRITLVNRYACSVLGWTADELHGRDWVETCLPPRTRDAVAQRLHNLTDGDLTVHENPVLTRSGEERLIEWRNTVLRDDAGQVIGTFSSGTDITERNQAVAALRAVEERTRFALEAARVGIWDMDFVTGVVQWSEILESQCGLQPGSFAGTFEAFIALAHPEDRGAMLETITKARRSGADFILSYRARWPDGTVRWLNGAGRMIIGTQGEPVRGVGITLDVTDLHAEQLKVLRMTMRTVQDIVSNALMSLYGFRAEAEPHVSPQALALFDHILADTAQRLRTIGNLENVAEKPMGMGMGIDYPNPSPPGKA